MKVLHLATADGGNGAAIAAYRVHDGLRRLGIESKMFVAQKRTDDPDVFVFRPPRDLASRLRRRMRSASIGRSIARYPQARHPDLEAFSDDRSPHTTDVVAQLPPGDVIHVHALLNFIDYRAFFSAVPRRTPVVRTMHDMSFFTGGCHYDGGCGRYVEQCGKCPRLSSETEHDLSRAIWRRKRAAFGGLRPDRLHVVATSRWLAQEARRSSLLGRFPVTIIPYGLDTDVFSPRDRRLARQVLGIGLDARVILFAAQPVTRRMKGFHLLAQALDGMDHPEALLVSVGSGRPPVDVPIPHVHLGHLGQERLLSLVYSAADVLVIPSMQEAFGLTALEATACGTPVIGFEVGGIVDTVRPGITGLLVPGQDVIALRAAIRELLGSPAKRQDMALACRDIAVREYSLEVQARRYAALYRQILAPTPAQVAQTG